MKEIKGVYREGKIKYSCILYRESWAKPPMKMYPKHMEFLIFIVPKIEISHSRRIFYSKFPNFLRFSFISRSYYLSDSVRSRLEPGLFWGVIFAGMTFLDFFKSFRSFKNFSQQVSLFCLGRVQHFYGRFPLQLKPLIFGTIGYAKFFGQVHFYGWFCTSL